MDLAKAFPLIVDEDSHGLRLDQFLGRFFPEISRSRWTRLIESETFSVDSKIVSPSFKLKQGQKVECLDPKVFHISKVEFTDEVVFKGTAPDVLFEDSKLLVINKPDGLAVHPGAGVALPETVVGWLLSTQRLNDLDTSEYVTWDDDIIEQRRPGIVHRLDRGTSGTLVIAKDPSTHEKLSKQFADRTAGRLYWAVVRGRVGTLVQKRVRRIEELLLKKPSPAAFRAAENGVYSFASFLERDPSSRTRFRVSSELEQGKKAITHFTEISESGDFSLVEVKLETGRTHQIRVHLSFLDFPIVGDGIYGGSEFNRILLHAHTLRFMHPDSKKKIEISAPWPKAAQEWLNSKQLELGTRLGAVQIP